LQKLFIRTCCDFFNLIEEIPRREKIFISSQNLKSKTIKKLNFKDLLLNINNVHKDIRRKLRLKRLIRKKKQFQSSSIVFAHILGTANYSR
jgi:hypothetical protein